MTHLINGMSNKQIAEVLSFSEKPLILIKSGYIKMVVSSVITLVNIVQNFEVE